MSDHLKRASEGAADKPGWLDGRASRREYWFWVGPSFGVAIGLDYAGVHWAIYVAGLVIFLIWIRRLHDIGWTGFVAPLINIVVGVVNFALTKAMGPTGAGPAGIFALLILLALGVVPGQRFVNRYGPPGRGRDVSEVFS
jgi:uncharacterized membrane protein YhaH (DUF805 family)